MRALCRHHLASSSSASALPALICLASLGAFLEASVVIFFIAFHCFAALPAWSPRGREHKRRTVAASAYDGHALLVLLLAGILVTTLPSGGWGGASETDCACCPQSPALELAFGMPIGLLILNSEFIQPRSLFYASGQHPL